MTVSTITENEFNFTAVMKKFIRIESNLRFKNSRCNDRSVDPVLQICVIHSTLRIKSTRVHELFLLDLSGPANIIRGPFQCFCVFAHLSVQLPNAKSERNVY